MASHASRPLENSGGTLASRGGFARSLLGFPVVPRVPFECRGIALAPTRSRQSQAALPSGFCTVAFPTVAWAGSCGLHSPVEEIRLIWERTDGTRLQVCLPASQAAQ